MAFELDEDESESPSGLPEAELTIEDQRRAQEEFRLKHPAP